LIATLQFSAATVIIVSASSGSPWHHLYLPLLSVVPMAVKMRKEQPRVAASKEELNDFFNKYLDSANYLRMFPFTSVPNVTNITALGGIVELIAAAEAKYAKEVPKLKLSIKDLEAMAQDYQKRFGNPFFYLMNTLPHVLEKVDSLERLKEWDTEVKSYTQEYKDRFGDSFIMHTFYVIPGIVQKAQTVDEMRRFKKDETDAKGIPEAFDKLFKANLPSKTIGG